MRLIAINRLTAQKKKTCFITINFNIISRVLHIYKLYIKNIIIFHMFLLKY